jgi:hypothetical protein
LNKYRIYTSVLLNALNPNLVGAEVKPFLGNFDPKITGSSVSVGSQFTTPDTEPHFQTNLNVIAEDGSGVKN